jgi:hypothetical protein
VRGKIRLKHDSILTEKIYVDWIKRFILPFGKCYSRGSGAEALVLTTCAAEVVKSRRWRYAAKTKKPRETGAFFAGCDADYTVTVSATSLNSLI